MGILHSKQLTGRSSGGFRCLSISLLVTFFFCFTPIFGQNVLWTSGFPKINPAPLTILDTTYVEVDFAVTANVTNANVVFTFPAGVSRTGNPEAMAGNTAPSLSITSNTVTVGNLTATSLVKFRLPVTTTCAIVSGGNINVKVNQNSTLLTNGNQNIAAVFQKPGINLLIPTDLVNYSNINESHPYTVKLNAVNGVLNNFTLTFTHPKVAGLNNFAIAGIPIPDNKITRRGINSGADTVVTVVLDKTFLPWKLSGTPVDLTIDAVTRTAGCTKVVTINGWYPSTATAAAATPNVAPSTACGTLSGTPQFTMKMNEVVGTASFTSVGNLTKVDGVGNPVTITSTCYDVNNISYYAVASYRNTGIVDGYIYRQNLNSYFANANNLGTAFIDTSQVYYQIDNNPEKKIDPSNITLVSVLSSVVARPILPAYASKPVSINIAIPEAVPAGSTIKYRTGIKEGVFYDSNVGSTMNNANNTISFPRYVQPYSMNACGVESPRTSGDASLSYSGPAIIGAGPPQTTLEPNEKGKITISGMYTGTAMQSNNGMRQSIDVFVKLPSWLSLDADSLAANKAIKWLNTAGVEANFWPLVGSITDQGNNTYSIHLTSDRNSTSGAIYNGGSLMINYQTGACQGNGNLNDSIYTWINYNSYQEGNAASVCRPTFPRIGYKSQSVTFHCKEDGFVMDDFSFYRITRGYKDVNNDQVPDDGALASYSDIDHYLYLQGDSGVITWKGHIAGTTSDNYNNLYALLTAPAQLSISSNGASDYLVPIGGDIYINGVLQSAGISYSMKDATHCYLNYNGAIKGTDSIEIRMPFYFRASVYSQNTYPFLGGCFVSNQNSVDPFADPKDKHGEDIMQRNVKVSPKGNTDGFYMVSNSQNAINDHTSHSFVQSVYWNFMNQWATPNFKNEARLPQILNRAILTMPEGYEFTEDSVRFSYRRYKSDGTYFDEIKYLKASAFSTSEMTFDLTQLFDADFPSRSASLAPGKWINPVEKSSISPFPMYRLANKGAPTQTNATIELFYTDVSTGQSYSNKGSVQLNYQGATCTVLSSVSTVSTSTSLFNIPVLTVGNSDTSPINNVWLYVEGNVKNLILDDGVNALIRGTGYQGRWLKITNQLASAAILQYNFKATYTGGTNCSDVFTVYATSAYGGSWTPNINSPLDKSDFDHSGAKINIAVNVLPTTIGGDLSLSSTAGLNVIAYRVPQTLHATLNTLGASGALDQANMEITVPKGQRYIAGTARLAYPSDATPMIVDPLFEAYLVTTLNADITVDRTFNFNFGQAIGDSVAMIAGVGTTAQQEAVLTMNFSPECETRLNGIRYEGVLSGFSACGVPASGSGKVIYSPYQYPSVTTNYQFSGHVSSTGSMAVGPFDKTIKLDVNLTKTSGANADMNANDSIEVKVHKAFNIVSATYTDPGLGALTQGSNTVSGDTRTLCFSFPVDYMNALPSKGVNASVAYNFEFAYNPSDYLATNGDSQVLSTSLVSNLVFDVNCAPQPAVIVFMDTTAAVLVFDPLPNNTCFNSTVQASIDNSGSNFDYEWFKERSMTTSLASGDYFDFPAITSGTDTLFIKVTNTLSQSMGVVRYPYTIYPAITFDLVDTLQISLGDSVDLAANLSNPVNVQTLKYYSDPSGTIELTTSIVAPLTDTRYYVQGVSSTGCKSEMDSVEVIVDLFSSDATLQDLQVGGISVPGFAPGITNYTYYVNCDVEMTDIVGIPTHPGATVTNFLNQHLEIGDNHYELLVIAENGVTSKKYYINVVRDCYVPKILKDLKDAVICVGDTHTFELQAEGQNLTYEWYYGLNRIMGANTNSLTISDAVLGDYERYYVVVRSNYNGFKSSAFSKKVRLWVADQLPTHLRFSEYPNPAITGNTYHIKVDGYTDVTKYTWSYDKEGVTFSPGADQKWGNEAWVTFGTLSAGNGTLKVTMEHPCGTRELTQAITVKYPTGMDDVITTTVQVYPNPTSGILKVSGTEMNQLIRVLDVTGSLKGTYKTMEGTTTIDLTGYTKGTYMVQYNGRVYKVIKN